MEKRGKKNSHSSACCPDMSTMLDPELDMRRLTPPQPIRTRLTNGSDRASEWPDSGLPQTSALIFDCCLFVFSPSPWLDHRQWSADTKAAFADLAQTQQDSMRNSFFWTWKIGKSLNQNFPPNPMWSYSNGLLNGYIRSDCFFLYSWSYSMNVSYPPPSM